MDFEDIFTKARSVQHPDIKSLHARIESLIGIAPGISDMIEVAMGDSPDAGLAVFILGIDDADKHAQTLLSILRSAPTEGIRKEAANALGKCSRTWVAARLCECLDCTNPMVRAEALYALSGLAPLFAQPIVTHLLETDPTPSVRSYAAETLSHIALRRNRRLLGFSEAVSALIRAGHDPDPCVRYSVISALGRLGSRRALSLLLQISQSDGAICPGLGALSTEAAMAISQIMKVNNI